MKDAASSVCTELPFTSYNEWLREIQLNPISGECDDTSHNQDVIIMRELCFMNKNCIMFWHKRTKFSFNEFRGLRSNFQGCLGANRM